jgi:hypothetical protein
MLKDRNYRQLHEIYKSINHNYFIYDIIIKIDIKIHRFFLSHLIYNLKKATCNDNYCYRR